MMPNTCSPNKNLKIINNTKFNSNCLTLIYLSFDFRQFLFVQAHPRGKHGNDESVSSIAKHDGKEKRESDDGVKAGIHFAVIGYSVSVN